MKRLFLSFCLAFYLMLSTLVEGTYVEYKAIKNADYIICIDGGGRKTELQVLDRKGSPLRLRKEGKTSTSFFGPPSNLNDIGEKGFDEMLSSLFEDLLIGQEQQTIDMIRKKSVIVAGFPGLSTPASQEKTRRLFEKRGFNPDQLLIFTDAQIALDLVQNRGAVLIGGTGTICMGVYQNKEFRAGGFGRFLHDGGSGYELGIASIHAALEDNFGYGASTPLTAVIKKQLGLADLREVLPLVNTGQIAPGKIAEIALNTLTYAKQGDEVSKKIVNDAINELALLIINVVKRIPGNEPTPIYLIGGLFEQDYPYKKEIESTSHFQEFKKNYLGTIELHNISQRNISSEVVSRCLRQADAPMAFLKTLPQGCLPYEAFEEKFSLGNTSTEKSHPVTKRLSQTMNSDIIEGLHLLLDVDELAYQGFYQHIDSLLNTLTPTLTRTFKEGGRVLLVGASSSGRVAIDLASKSNRFSPKYGKQVEGLIAGGDSCIIRAKEGVEDSEAEGKLAIGSFHLSSRDTVIFISGSGATSFNVGAGHAAADAGASVFFFYNSVDIPKHTQALFNRDINPVYPLLMDTGPQSITGSTRLQSANLSECCIGCALAVSLMQAQEEYTLSAQYPKDLANKIQKMTQRIRVELQQFKDIIQMEVGVFSDPRANFRRITDVTNRGYITLLSDKKSIRESFMDTCETPATFSTSHPRRNEETHRKREEFRAYLFDEKNESKAWESLLGRAVRKENLKDTSEFVLSGRTTGVNSYPQRPLGPGNCVIGTFNLSADESLSSTILEALKQAKQKGTLTGALIVSERKLSEEDKAALVKVADHVIYLDALCCDSFGLTQTLALKTSLNLISSSSMVLMNKVHGNRMVDVRASNYKLVDRCIRLCESIWSESFPDKPIDHRSLYYYVQHVKAYKRKKQAQGAYTPSVVKIVLNLLYYGKTPKECDEIVEKIIANQERLDFLTNE